MAAVILETLSTKKLIVFFLFILILQIAAFLIGGLIEAAPSHVMSVLGTKCWGNHSNEHTDLIYTRKIGQISSRLHKGNCKEVTNEDYEEAVKDGKIHDNVIYVFQMPLPRESTELRMSRWFQYMVGVLHLENQYDKEEFPFAKNAKFSFKARLAYTDKIKTSSKKWILMSESKEDRSLTCNEKNHECDILPLFEIGSVHHEFYLLNIQIPFMDNENNRLLNQNVGKLSDIYLHIIMQTGGFTRIWFSMKTVTFPILLMLLIFFVYRVRQLNRPPNLLEKVIIGIGSTMLLLDFPIEWLTLLIKIPFMLLINDIRQGIFYCALLCFWIVFCGEHSMDSNKLYKNRLLIYWKELTAISFGSSCLFIFELCERGVQLRNPFFTIWADKTGSKVAFSFIIFAGIAACIYFILLVYVVVKVVRNISHKKSALSGMNIKKQKYYRNLIYRFNFLIISTLIFAAMTVIFFIISQVKDGIWKWGSESWHDNDKDDVNENYNDNPLHYTSAFFTGVLVMWNIYVGSLLFLYAPSKKIIDLSSNRNSVNMDDSDAEEIEFSQMQSEATALAPRGDLKQNAEVSFIYTARKQDLD